MQKGSSLSDRGSEGDGPTWRIFRKSNRRDTDEGSTETASKVCTQVKISVNNPGFMLVFFHAHWPAVRAHLSCGNLPALLNIVFISTAHLHFQA